MLEYRVSLYPDLPLKVTLKLPHLNSDLRNECFRSVLPYEVVFIPKS